MIRFDDAPQTLLEFVATLMLIGLTTIMLSAIAIEYTTGLPARIAIERWLYDHQ